MPSIALFGAAGAIGQSLATALRQQGRAYRVVGRNAASLRQTFGADPLAEIVPWNPDSTGSVEAAAHGVDTLVYLVGVNYWQFALHPELMRRTLDGAIAAGVRRIVLIGTVYPYGKAQAHAVKEDHPRNPHTFKGRMRKAQEDLLLQAHAQGRIEAAVLRLPDFYGPGVHNSLLHGAFEAAARGGRADMVGPLDRPHEFVYVPDVGPVVARLIGTPQAFGKVWHLAGAGAITQRDVVSDDRTPDRQAVEAARCRKDRAAPGRPVQPLHARAGRDALPADRSADHGGLRPARPAGPHRQDALCAGHTRNAGCRQGGRGFSCELQPAAGHGLKTKKP